MFPVGFKIWNTEKFKKFKEINVDVFDSYGIFQGEKTFYSYDEIKGRINDWVKSFKYLRKSLKIGEVGVSRNDVQHIALTWIAHKADRGLDITNESLIIDSIFLTIQHCINFTWLNDRDQFLFPNDNWKTDKEFQNDCLAFTLFHGQNRITSKEGTNHWIPFTEQEVNAKEKFESNFMSDFIKGKIKTEQQTDNLFNQENKNHPTSSNTIRQFSAEATAVFDAGRALWTYYHAQPVIARNAHVIARNEAIYNVNASLYDIREHFQGRNAAGKMNNKSNDETYMQLITALRDNLKTLAKKIEPKVYEYGFLKA